MVINWQERMGFSEPIDFVLDNNQVEPRITEIWASFLSNLPEHLQKYVGQKPRFDDDKRVRPLQAADSYAWWVRRWRETDGFIHGEKLPYPWNPKVAFPRLTIEVHRGAIEHEMESLKVRVYALMAAGSDLSQKPR